MTKLIWPLLLALVGCATAQPGVEEVLETTDYTLSVVRHCPVEQTACTRLTATLLDKRFGDQRRLTGTTSMSKCVDGVTPCRWDFYDLKAKNLSVRAYPDGSLDIQSYDVYDLGLRGTWRRQD